MRKEIEVKAKVDDFDKITHALIELGCVLSQPITQHDTIFVEDDYGPFEQFQPKKNLLRIRESNGEFILTVCIFIKFVGIKSEDRIYDGYDTLIYLYILTLS